MRGGHAYLLALVVIVSAWAGCFGSGPSDGAAGPLEDEPSAEETRFAEVGHAVDSPTAVLIVWEATGGVASSWIEWGPTGVTANTTAPLIGDGTHEHLLTGLAPNATYSYRIHGVGVAGPLASDGYVFETPEPSPLATDLSLEALGPDSASFRWLATGVGGLSAIVEVIQEGASWTDSAMVVPAAQSTQGSWTANVTALSPNSSYQARAVVVQYDGQTAVTDGVNFTTADIPLAVTALGVTNVTETAATIRWSAQGPDGSTVHVLYGQTAQTLLNATEPTDASSGEVTTRGLKPNQTYVYRVVVQAPNGTRLVTEIQELTTAVPPAWVDSVRILEVSANSTVIAWNVSGSADASTELSFVEPGDPSPSTVPADPHGPGSKAVRIEGLRPDTTYVYRVHVYINNAFLYSTTYRSVTTLAA